MVILVMAMVMTATSTTAIILIMMLPPLTKTQAATRTDPTQDRTVKGDILG